MRIRANLTRTEARLITFYLQTLNIPEAGVQAILAPINAHTPLATDEKQAKKKKKRKTDS